MTIVGDTRFDLVLENRQEAKDLSLVKLFNGNSLTFVAGSSWQPDEDLFIEYFNQHPEMKLIIAPHVIDENHLVEIIRKLKRPYVRYTRADEQNVLQVDCLIIDCFGLLSSIYRYGEIAYIGGGFGAGIHNTLEAAVYGIPVIFGPKYQKFQEAIQMLESGGGFSVKTYGELKVLLDRMLSDSAFLHEAGQKAGGYVLEHSGATDKILSMINFYNHSIGIETYSEDKTKISWTRGLRNDLSKGLKYDFDEADIKEGDYPITFSTQGRELKIETTDRYEVGQRIGLYWTPEDIHVMRKMG